MVVKNILHEIEYAGAKASYKYDRISRSLKIIRIRLILAINIFFFMIHTYNPARNDR